MSRSVSAWIEFKGSLWEAPMGPSLCMDMKNCSLFIVHWKITKHSSTFFYNISQHQSGYFLVPLAPTPDQLVSQSVTRSFRLSLCHCLWDLHRDHRLYIFSERYDLTKKMPTYLYTYLPNYLPTYFPLETINQTFDIFSVMRKHKMTKKKHLQCRLMRFLSNALVPDSAIRQVANWSLIRDAASIFSQTFNSIPSKPSATDFHKLVVKYFVVSGYFK